MSEVAARQVQSSTLHLDSNCTTFSFGLVQDVDFLFVGFSQELLGTRKCLAPARRRAEGAPDHAEDDLVCHHRHGQPHPPMAPHLHPPGRPGCLLHRRVHTAQDQTAFVLTTIKIVMKYYILLLDMLAAFASKYKSIIEQNSFKQSKNMVVMHSAIMMISTKAIFESLGCGTTVCSTVWKNKPCLFWVLKRDLTKTTGSLIMSS